MRNEAGFTLVELLAALVAGGLLLAALGSLTGLFGGALRRSGHEGAFTDIATAAPLLDHLLATASAPAGSTDIIEASGGHLSTEIDPPLGWRGAGPLHLTLDVVHAADGAALDLALTPPDGHEIRGFPIERRLLHGLRAISIALEADDEARRPPRLVTITFETKAGETWPLAIEPRLNASGGCRFDPISMTCRQ